MSTITEQRRPTPLPRNGNEPRRRIRLAHLQLLPILSGVQRVSLDILSRLDPECFDCTLICQEEGPLTKAAEQIGVKCMVVPELTRPIHPIRDTTALLKLYRLFRRHPFDILHTHSSKTGLLGRLAAKAAGATAVIHTVHGFAFPAATSAARRQFYRYLEMFGGRFTDALICLKESDINTSRETLHIPTDRLHLIPNGVDTSRYRPLDPDSRAAVRREVFELEEGQLAVGTVGRLARQKNPQCFVKAADAALRQGIDAHFFLIGDGELADETLALIRKTGHTDRIHILGWRSDVPQLLPALDLFVLTSRWEGLSLAILEAQAAGLPTVVSDIPGNRDLVTSGKDGIIADDDDPEMFGKCIVTLLKDRVLRQQMGRRAREKTVEEYDLNARVDRIVELYEALWHNRSVEQERLGRQALAGGDEGGRNGTRRCELWPQQGGQSQEAEASDASNWQRPSGRNRSEPQPTAADTPAENTEAETSPTPVELEPVDISR